MAIWRNFRKCAEKNENWVTVGIHLILIHSIPEKHRSYLFSSSIKPVEVCVNMIESSNSEEVCFEVNYVGIEKGKRYALLKIGTVHESQQIAIQLRLIIFRLSKH